MLGTWINNQCGLPTKQCNHCPPNWVSPTNVWNSHWCQCEPPLWHTWECKIRAEQLKSNRVLFPCEYQMLQVSWWIAGCSMLGISEGMYLKNAKMTGSGTWYSTCKPQCAARFGSSINVPRSKRTASGRMDMEGVKLVFNWRLGLTTEKKTEI